MALPPGITKKLLQATSDKTDLNKQALRFNRSFKEVGKLLGSGSAKAKKIRIKITSQTRTHPPQPPVSHRNRQPGTQEFRKEPI